jgi:hypothetical protein
MFTQLYLDTTNPEVSYTTFFQWDILHRIFISTLVHVFMYILAIQLFAYAVSYSISPSMVRRCVVVLMVVMLGGFMARFWHAKEIYATYNDLYQTRQHMNQQYISWIFMS